MKKFVFILIVLILMASAVAFYYYERNVYSKDALKLEILGPEETESFQEVEYVVKFKNNGNVRLEEPELVFDYPENAIIEGENSSRRVVKKAEELGGVIYPGQEKTFTFVARLVGKEGEKKAAKAELSYRPKELKARYNSKTSLTTVIKKVPISLDFDLSSKIESGKDFSFSLNYFSNVDYPVSGLALAVDYPSGFEFSSSAPESSDESNWEIGLLNKAEGGRVKVSGTLMGEVGEEKIFRAKIGAWIEGNFVVLREVSKGITIIRPALHITQQINGNPKFVATPGDLLHYEIFFKNIGEEYLTDMFLLTTLSSDAFDLATVRTPEGDFTPGDNSIIWDWRRVRDLQMLQPQSEGKVEFWVKLKEKWDIDGNQGKNPEIKTTVFLSQAKEEFVNKVNSKLIVEQNGYFQDEVFGNIGPFPPEEGKTTTYTITWQVKNYYNELENVKAKAVLSDRASLTGKIFPEDRSDEITFDSESREIIWNIGKMEAGEGVSSPAPNISFQISFSPKEGSSEIIGSVEIIGQDRWTGEDLNHSSSSLNSLLE
jgi:hypothetical protein